MTGEVGGPETTDEMPATSAIDREIRRLALPALATLLAEPLYVLTDTAIVGHLGTNQLAGLALASTVLLTGYAVFVFLAYGTTATVARLVGAGRGHQAAGAAVQSLWLATALGVVAALVTAVVGEELLSILGGRGAVLHEGWVYLRVSLFGIPALLVALAGTGYLRGLARMRVPLVITIVGVLVNLTVEVILIFGLGYGIGASAVGSVIAQWLVAAAYVGLIGTDIRRLGVGLRPRIGGMVTQMRIGVDLFVRTVALRAALLVTTAVAAGMGAVPLAAHQIVFEVWNFLAMLLDSIAIAAQSIIGNTLGAGESARARFAAQRMMQWAFRVGVVALVALAALSPVLGRLFTPDVAVLALTPTLLFIAAASQPVNAFAFTLDGVLIGAGDTRFLAVSMAVVSAVHITFALLVANTHLGIAWLWGALAALMCLRSILLGLRLRGGHWARTGAEIPARHT